MMKTATASLLHVPSIAVKASSPILHTLMLRERDVHSLDLREGERCILSFRNGVAWVTMEGNPDDFALTKDSPPSEFTGPGRLVIEAIGGEVKLEAVLAREAD